MGHWSRECQSERKPKASAASSATGTSSVSTARSGFLVVSSPAKEAGSASNFWLKELIQQAKTREGPIHGEYKAADPIVCGITTQPHHGLVDTAAERGLIGKPALDRLQDQLQSRGT